MSNSEGMAKPPSKPTEHLVIVLSSDTLSRQEMESGIKEMMKRIDGAQYVIVPKEHVYTYEDSLGTLFMIGAELPKAQ